MCSLSQVWGPRAAQMTPPLGGGGGLTCSTSPGMGRQEARVHKGMGEVGLQPSPEGFLKEKEKEKPGFLATDMGHAKTLRQSQAETETDQQRVEGTESKSVRESGREKTEHRSRGDTKAATTVSCGCAGLWSPGVTY